MDLFFIADVIGIIAFAFSGYIVAIRNELDLLGILISSFLTALGGGIVRDVILNTTPFTFREYYPASTVLAVLAFAFIFKLYKKEDVERKLFFVISDTIGLVAFSITGALLALEAEFNIFGVIILSFLTAVGGGLTRDILINKVPAVLVTDFYGSISLVVAILLFWCDYLDFLNEISILIISALAITLRLLAYFKGWRLPKIQK
ncbi:TRIC cation channel family protein [Sulfurimonas sp. MAG313]|nr:TRIC cation channel family protein [Sulfurimonas sp. MAG313]MDF1879942.1 TRIC cation channel family protein [Sulfurimonas sp. MAG313]